MPRDNRQNLKTRKEILVICDGPTEINYFNNVLTQYFNDNTENIKYKLKFNCKKLLTVKKVENYLDHNPARANPVLVLRIADLDTAESDLTNRNELKNFSRKTKLEWKTVFTYPCFEFWYILHFKFCEKPFVNPDETIGELRNYIENYEKTMPRNLDTDIRNLLLSKVDDAIVNEKCLNKINANCTTLKCSQGIKGDNSLKNPMSEMGKIIEHLKRICS